MNNKEKVIIIAEIGECYSGDLNIAKKLMQESKNTGCDYVKFQTLDYENISDDDPEKDWCEKIALKPETIKILMEYAREIECRILFTPENIKTAKWLLEAGCREIKIASSSITDESLLGFINDKFKIVFMSTGMASLDEVNNAIGRLNKISDLFVMHCISEYPFGPLLEQRGLRALSSSDINLNMMKMLMALYPGIKVGYSDHTDGILAPVAAVAAGAQVIEKHITLDRKTPVENFLQNKEFLGTDHVLSIEPKELNKMVLQIREVERMFGEWKWERSDGEKLLMDLCRGRFDETA